MIESLLYKEETDRKYFRAKVDLARSLFDKRHDFNGTLLEVNNIQESFYLGCQAIIMPYRNRLKCQQAQEICTKIDDF